MLHLLSVSMAVKGSVFALNTVVMSFGGYPEVINYYFLYTFVI